MSDANATVKLQPADLAGFYARLNSWREQQLLCDLQLRALSGEHEWVHKLVILAASPALQPARLLSPVLSLPCSAHALQALVRFLYGEEVEVSVETVFELKLCAEGLSIAALVAECDAAMRRITHSAHEQLQRLHVSNGLVPPPLSLIPSLPRPVPLLPGFKGEESLESELAPRQAEALGAHEAVISSLQMQRRASMPASCSVAAAAAVAMLQQPDYVNCTAADSTTQRSSPSRTSKSDNELDDAGSDPGLKRKLLSEQMPLRKRSLRPTESPMDTASRDELVADSEKVRRCDGLDVSPGSGFMSHRPARHTLRMLPPRQHSADELLSRAHALSSSPDLIPRPRGTLTTKLELIRQANRQLMGDTEQQEFVSGRLSHKLRTIRRANEELLRNFPSQPPSNDTAPVPERPVEAIVPQSSSDGETLE